MHSGSVILTVQGLQDSRCSAMTRTRTQHGRPRALQSLAAGLDHVTPGRQPDSERNHDTPGIRLGLALSARAGPSLSLRPVSLSSETHWQAPAASAPGRSGREMPSGSLVVSVPSRPGGLGTQASGWAA
jgi:hypothetical protein